MRSESIEIPHLSERNPEHRKKKGVREDLM
jgi:hypothetical protein